MSNYTVPKNNINDKLNILDEVKLNKVNNIIIESDDLVNFIVDSKCLIKHLKLDEAQTAIISNLGESTNIYSLISDISTRKIKIFDYIKIKPTIKIGPISIGIETNTKNLVKKLMKGKEKNIVIVLNDFNNQEEDMRSCISNIGYNINQYLEDYNKDSITILLFSKNQDDIKVIKNCSLIEIDNLNADDIYNLAINCTEFKNLPYDEFKKVYELNSGNCNKTFFTLRLLKNDNYRLNNETVDNLINKLIKKVNDEIKFKDTNTGYVLRLFSVFPRLFDPYEVIKLDSKIEESELERNIDILEKLIVLKKENVDTNYYSMIQVLKENIFNQNLKNRKTIFETYYKYLTKYFPLEFQRKIDLQTNYLHDIDEIKFQYLLKYEYYYTNQMHDNIDDLFNYIDSNDDLNELKSMFNDASYFNYNRLSSLSDKYACNNKKLNAFWIKKDIEYFSTSNNDYVKLKNLCDILYNIVIEDKIFDEDPFYKVLYLIVLIPQYIDKFNDEDKTNKLLQELEETDKQPCSNETRENIELCKNILYRKSYLFKNVDSAIFDCKVSLKYFKMKNNIPELYMTLNTLMCLEIVEDKIESAIKRKEQIEILDLDKSIKDEYQYYKTEMNFILLDIFDNKIDNKHAIDRYERILYDNKDISKTTINIICLNICALSLESDDICTYKKYKDKIQKINGIDEIVDFENQSIDNFYIYHFSWFEFGLKIMEGKIEEAKNIYKRLNDFIPTIYKKDGEILYKKHKLFNDIFKNKSLNGEQFSNYIFNKKTNVREARFFFRGFMLSDIHHTSLI